jgi:hypothetical protein
MLLTDAHIQNKLTIKPPKKCKFMSPETQTLNNSHNNTETFVYEKENAIMKVKYIDYTHVTYQLV